MSKVLDVVYNSVSLKLLLYGTLEKEFDARNQSQFLTNLSESLPSTLLLNSSQLVALNTNDFQGTLYIMNTSAQYKNIIKPRELDLVWRSTCSYRISLFAERGRILYPRSESKTLHRLQAVDRNDDSAPWKAQVPYELQLKYRRLRGNPRGNYRARTANFDRLISLRPKFTVPLWKAWNWTTDGRSTRWKSAHG